MDGRLLAVARDGGVMSERAWKAFERRVARMLGTERIPAAANPKPNAPDFVTECFAYQAKKGYSPPAYIRGWLKGILSTSGERTGVVVWAGKRTNDSNALVVLRLEDWVRIASFLERRREPPIPMEEW